MVPVDLLYFLPLELLYTDTSFAGIASILLANFSVKLRTDEQPVL